MPAFQAAPLASRIRSFIFLESPIVEEILNSREKRTCQNDKNEASRSFSKPTFQINLIERFSLKSSLKTYYDHLVEQLSDSTSLDSLTYVAM